MVTYPNISISLVNRYPATAAATSHFLGGRRLGPPLPPPPPSPPPHGCTPQHWHWLGYPIPRHDTRYLTLSRWSHVPACIATPAHGWVPWYRHQLGYLIPPHGTRYLTLPWRSHVPACVATPAHGWVPWYRHPLGYPIPRHCTCYLTLPQRSWAWAPTTATSSTYILRLRATASASALSPGSPLQHLPHTSAAGSHFGVCCCTPSQAHTPAFAAVYILGSLALWRAHTPPLHSLSGCTLRPLLPHTFPVGSRSVVSCHTHSRRSCTPAHTHTSTPPSRSPRTPVSAATHLCGRLACHESHPAGSSVPLPVPPSPLPPCGLPSSPLPQPRSSSALRRLDRSPPYRAASDISPTYRPPASLGPFSLSPLYCLRVLLLSDVCVSLWLSLRVLLLSYVCVSLWLSLRVLLLFPHCSCLRVLSPVAASRVLATRRPSAMRCFPWARRLSHDVVWRNCVSLAGKL